MVNCNNTMLGDDASATTDVDEARIVVFRYSEYCVTAPLLFLSVVSLLTVDAPAWLYISGYGLIVACNLWGIVLHYSITWPTKGTSEDTQSFVLWLNSLLLTGSWKSKWVNEWYFMEAAWICLLLPMSGLVYLINDYLFSASLPWVARIMIWNLFIAYSLFGIVPSLVYISGKGLSHLDWLLDILNVGSKFILPILILVAFQTRPAMFRACTAE